MIFGMENSRFSTLVIVLISFKDLKSCSQNFVFKIYELAREAMAAVDS